MSSGAITGVITKAEIPKKIFYYVNGTPEVEEIIPEGILPDSLDSSHENKYYYNNTENKLYRVIKNGEAYDAKEIIAAGVLPDPPYNENHIDNYYYTYNGAEEYSIGVSSFSRIWGKITDDEGNPIKNSENEPIALNLQDAMNALFKMMASQSHVWVGNEGNVPDYAKLLIETEPPVSNS